MIKGLHHTGVATRDLERLCGFYVDRFHGTVLADFAWDESNTDLSARLGLETSAGRIRMLGFGDSRLEVFEFSCPTVDALEGLRSAAKPGFSHIAFEVDNAQAEFERLTRAGMAFHAPLLKMPAGGLFAYGRDPDGNIVEIIQPPPRGHSTTP